MDVIATVVGRAVVGLAVLVGVTTVALCFSAVVPTVEVGTLVVEVTDVTAAVVVVVLGVAVLLCIFGVVTVGMLVAEVELDDSAVVDDTAAAVVVGAAVLVCIRGVVTIGMFVGVDETTLNVGMLVGETRTVVMGTFPPL